MIDKQVLCLTPIATDNKSISALFKVLDIDFPATARIPLVLLRASLKKQRIKGVYLTDEETNYGYAVYQHSNAHNVMHILYLAILPEYRSSGLGSILMNLLSDMANGRVILDAEDPDKAKGDKAKQICIKRNGFYLRNGYHVCPDFKFANFGYHLRVFTNCEFPELDWLQFYRQLYDNAYGLPISILLIRPY